MVERADDNKNPNAQQQQQPFVAVVDPFSCRKKIITGNVVYCNKYKSGQYVALSVIVATSIRSVERGTCPISSLNVTN